MTESQKRLLETYKGWKFAKMLEAKPIETSFEFIDSLIQAARADQRNIEKQRIKTILRQTKDIKEENGERTFDYATIRFIEEKIQHS